jgi:PAS domain S-box-containing protein
MRFSTRLALVMVGLVVLTALAVGALMHRSIKAAVVPRELTRLSAHTELLAGAIEEYVRATTADVLAASRLPDVDSIIQAQRQGTSDSRFRKRLAATFRATLWANPQYLQFRLIDGRGHAKELVRVEHPSIDSTVVVVPDEELQDKGHRDYVGATLGLPKGAVYVSRIDLNQEHGAIQVPYVPVMRVASPVRDSIGPFGLAIINVDMRPLFDRLRQAEPAGHRVYVASDDGSYLVHPDSSHVFGRELGRSGDWRRDFPGFEAVARSESSARGLVEAGHARVGAAAVTVRPAGGPPLVIIETERESELLDTVAAVRRSSLVGAAAVALVAVLMALLLARSLTRPLLDMSVAVTAFGRSRVWTPPSSATGEVGVLADSFTRMVSEVEQKTQQLEQEVEDRTRTERLRAAEADRLHLLTAAVSSSDDGIYTITLDGVITSWNAGAERMYGYASEEAVGQHLGIVATPDRQAEVDDIVRRLQLGERIRDLETVSRTQQGAAIDVSLSMAPVRSESGAVLAGVLVARDITNRRLADERFRLAVEASPSAVVMVAKDGAIVMANAETERLFGYPREELLGQSVEMLVPRRLRDAHPSHRGNFIAGPSTRAMGAGRDLFGLRKDGTEVPVEVGLTPIRTREGLHVLSVIIDISERKRAEAIMAIQADELRRSNRELEHFAHVASHDLQEPLRMVSSYTELLAQRYGDQLDERAHKYIRYAVEGAKRMSELVNDLLEVSRVGTHGGPLVSTDAGAIVAGVLRDMQLAIVESGAEVDLPDPMPLVLADPVQLGQLFQNLISNAIKFQSGQRAPVVRLTVNRGGELATFSIEDNGIGIEPQHAKRVFQLFQRLHERERYEGSGIGLALAQKIVERHGGRLWFDSVPGRGSTFHFTLTAV